jgi:hypothetical protein
MLVRRFDVNSRRVRAARQPFSRDVSQGCRRSTAIGFRLRWFPSSYTLPRDTRGVSVATQLPGPTQWQLFADRDLAEWGRLDRTKRRWRAAAIGAGERAESGSRMLHAVPLATEAAFARHATGARLSPFGHACSSERFSDPGREIACRRATSHGYQHPATSSPSIINPINAANDRSQGRADIAGLTQRGDQVSIAVVQRGETPRCSVQAKGAAVAKVIDLPVVL